MSSKETTNAFFLRYHVLYNLLINAGKMDGFWGIFPKKFVVDLGEYAKRVVCN